MSPYKWIKRLFGSSDFRKLSALVHEGFAQFNSRDYVAARATFLSVLEFRDHLAGTELLRLILEALDTSWILRDEYEEGIAFFSEYIRMHPGEAAAYCGRANGLWYLGRLQEAVDDYTRAIDLRPDTIAALSGRAQVLAEMGRHGEALKELDHVLNALKKQSAVDSGRGEWYKHIEAFARRARGAALAGVGDVGAAMDEFAASIALSPENAWVFFSRAELHQAMGNEKSALTDYELALEKRSPHLNLGRRDRAQARARELRRMYQ